MLEQETHRPPASVAIDSAFLAIVFAFLALFREIYIDDTFITLSYARTFAESGVWGMHAPFVSNAATSPLNVLLLSALIKIGLSGPWAVYVLECILAATIFATLKFISWRVFGSPLWAYLGTLALFTNPLLISTSGLETYLFIAALFLCCLIYILERYLLLGFAAGLLFMARPDGILLFVPLFALMLWERRAAQFAKVMFGAAVVIGIWSFLAWRYLGSAIPDTYFIKRNQPSWFDFTFVDGLLLYYIRYPVATLLSLALLPFVPLGLPLVGSNKIWRAFVILAGGTAVLHYIAYSALRVPPYHWYYGPFLSAVAVIGAAGLVVFAQKSRGARVVSFGLAIVISAAGAVTCAQAAWVRAQMPIHSNWGTVAQYRQIANWINAHVSAPDYRLYGELGVIQYYSHPNGVNDFSDREILYKLVDRLPNGSIEKFIAKLNFANLRRPPPVKSNYALLVDCKATHGILQRWTTSSTWLDSPIAWCMTQEK